MRPERVRFWPVLAFTHRWLGIAGCLLFLVWFLSGIAMMYVRMPALSTDERLARAPSLAGDAIRMAPSEAASAAGNPEATDIELGMLGDRPVYRIGRGTVRIVFADSGVLPSAPSSMSPYAGWLKWHHYAGLIFGVITLTWTFSGLLSMGPFSWLSHDGLTGSVVRATAGGMVTADGLSADDVRAAAGALQSSMALKEMRLVAFRGHTYWLGTESATQHRLVPANGPWTAFDAFPRAEMEAAARSAGLGTVADLAWLDEYDEYYYDRTGRRPLPVLRARYTDEAATWSYLDPVSGAATLVVGRRDRLNRWLYHGLHSLDPAWLRNRRPLWDVVVIVLSLGGIAGVATSLVPAWRRLRTLFPRRRRTARPAIIR